jgi:SAM-dependent methyltransferase
MRVLNVTSDITESGTDQYYRDHALAYAESTLGVDMSEIYGRFLGYLPRSAKILDAGSGSGRDTLAFKNLGYNVDAFDASPALCAFSTQLTGVPARVQTFQDFESEPVYDGIWACASLLHVRADELDDAVRRLVHALKPEGALYMSFKHGSGERLSADGRFYLDMDEERLRAVLNDVADAHLSEIWVSHGEGSRRGRDAWLNAILVRTPGANSNHG